LSAPLSKKIDTFYSRIIIAKGVYGIRKIMFSGKRKPKARELVAKALGEKRERREREER
jgi:hypothetical protein